MPWEIVKVVIVRPTSTRTATGGHIVANVPIPNSPIDGWDCRLYRKPQITVQRNEAGPGVATVDSVRVLSILDTTAPVQVGDIAQLPGGVNAKILRPRRYTYSLQCDLETGAE